MTLTDEDLRHLKAPAAPKSGDAWTLTRDDAGVAWLTLDLPGESANTISEDVLDGLDARLAELEAEKPEGLVMRSGKTSGFAAGADIRAFRGMTDQAAVEAAMRRAHEVVDRLAALPRPTVALIDGFCLGAGLEVALACDFRIGTPACSLGFPEVLLGLHPGLGGTYRLTALIDPIEAMTMMLTGKSAHAKKARKLGLIDEIAEPRHLEAAALAAIDGRLKTSRGGLKARLLSTGPARRYAAEKMRNRTRARAPEAHYPAPYALIRLWERAGGAASTMQAGEIASFARLMAGETAQALIRVFFLRERLKSLGNRKDAAGIRHVHVVGAGLMGGDIAAWCALKGLRVSLADQDRDALARAVRRAADLFEAKLHTGPDRRDARDRLIPDFEGAGVGAADLVIEAIAETVEAKIGLYAELEPRMKPGAILATNTSSLPLETLAKTLARPERFLGVHFFNPVAKMELVEIVSHPGAEKDALAAARGLVARLGRLPAPVASALGFLVNRVLTPYLMEAILMIDEGASPASVDAAAERFGMAMGPATVADRVGLDICLHVADALREGLDQPMPDAPDWLKKKVEDGDLGVKTGAGLYAYDDDGKPKKGGEAAKPDDEMADRMILPMLNASAASLREKVVEDAETLDAALIFAAGFAPFRGGPAAYARTRGVDDVKAALAALEKVHGPRFAPDEGLSLLKKAG